MKTVEFLEVNIVKISIIGAGKVGSTTAWYLLHKNLGEVMLYDITEGQSQGIALDLNESAPLQKFEHQIIGTNKIEDIKDSDIVVITAGFPRKPGMDRKDLLKKNKEIVDSVSADIKKHATNSIVIVVTNPLDIMAYCALKATGFPAQRVIGMSGVLDSSRMRYFIAKELNVSVKDVEAIVIGSHGNEMVPLPNYTTVNGKPIEQLLSKEKLNEIIEHTKNAGGEIVAFLKTGSAYHAPAVAIAEMVEAIVKDKKKLLPCCAYLNGEYGFKGFCLGVPCILGRNGIEKIEELVLTVDEKAQLNEAAKVIENEIKSIQ